MKKPPANGSFATRPGAAERWIRTPTVVSPQQGEGFSARLTIDVTPAVRRRLKLAAVTRGTTVADLMRALIDRHFPDDAKETS